MISNFVLEPMGNEKYDIFWEIHKIRALTAMNLIFVVNIPHIVVDS
jgi:hypothetical protein